MNDTTAPATQAELDAQTYEAYVRNGESKAATARELEIGATTVAARIKRHLARTEQDAADETPAEDADAEVIEPTAVISPAEAHGHDSHEHGAEGHEHGLDEFTPASTSTPAADTATAPAEPAAKDDLVTECVKCGFKFSKPQRRQTCQSEKACQKRQDAKAAAAAGA